VFNKVVQWRGSSEVAMYKNSKKLQTLYHLPTNKLIIKIGEKKLWQNKNA